MSKVCVLYKDILTSCVRAPRELCFFARVSMFPHRIISLRRQDTPSEQQSMHCIGRASTAVSEGPLCAEPFGDDFKSVEKGLLADSGRHRSLSRVHEETTADDELPCGPLPCPTVHSAPGYVPKANLKYDFMVLISEKCLS